MNKAELIAALAQTTGLPQTATRDIIDALTLRCAESLRSTGEIALPGIGKLSLVTRAARTGRNVRTGEPIQIPEKKAVKFKASSSLTAGII